MPDFERILELEKEDRLRLRLKDRDKWDLLYLWSHPLRRHDVEMLMYYFHIGIILYCVRVVDKYFVWVKREFKHAKERDDTFIEAKRRDSRSSLLARSDPET